MALHLSKVNGRDMNKLLLMIILMPVASAMAQQTDSTDRTPTKVLQEVIVRGYESNRSIKEVAAAMSVISNQQLQKFGSTSILPAVNATPGVRMEERSPGSFRLNIRGSSLRSPFGVRNIKIYWNDIPFTDPGGNTYLNQFSFYNFSSVEILKGPGSSLYGAGTGGVMLINSFPQTSGSHISLNYSGGSYHGKNVNVSATTGNESFQSKIDYTHQQSDGYREQSAMERDIFSWQTRIQAGGKQTISTQVLYGNLHYQTPGGLTRAQYLANPRAARPAVPAAGLAGAIGNKAAIFQKTFWAGISDHYKFNDHFENTTSVYGAFSQIKNPSIRNYERRLEPNFGGRTTFSYTGKINHATLKIVAGAEAQQGYAIIKVYKNNKGNGDSLQTDDEVNNYLAAVFLQGELSLPGGWVATAGASLNQSSVRFERLSVVPTFNYRTSYNNQVAPRVSLLKKINAQSSVYALVSKGFSPPTVAELLPSTSVINTDLQAETGLNYEIGYRADLFNSRLSIDVNAFVFRLDRSITARRDITGADYFVNSGKTNQDGIETALRYALVRNTDGWVPRVTLWFNHSYQHFFYKDFKQGTADVSGKQLPGIAPHTVSTGVDLSTRAGVYLNINYFYSDPIAMNDANTEYANSYNLLGVKAGIRRSFCKHLDADLFVSGDNLFNQTYSLGNDINAAGNRFYNAAAGRNFLIGLGISL